MMLNENDYKQLAKAVADELETRFPASPFTDDEIASLKYLALVVAKVRDRTAGWLAMIIIAAMVGVAWLVIQITQGRQ